MNEVKLKIKKISTFIAILVLVMILLFFSSSLQPWQGNSWFLSTLHTPIYSLENIWHKSIKSIKDHWKHYIDLSQAAHENTELKKKIFLLETQNIFYQSKVRELERIKKTLGFLKKYEHQVRLVEVTSKRLSPPFQSFRVNRGKDDQIKVGMPVVATEGVVGRVIRTGPMYSDIQLLSDNSFNLDVMLERTRLQTSLQGSGENLCQIRLNQRADIQLEDRIVSSGVSGPFPEGLPIGKVIQITYESDLVEQVITIKPWVKYSKLHEVVIINKVSKDFNIIARLAPKFWFNRVIDELRPKYDN